MDGWEAADAVLELLVSSDAALTSVLDWLICAGKTSTPAPQLPPGLRCPSPNAVHTHLLQLVKQRVRHLHAEEQSRLHGTGAATNSPASSARLPVVAAADALGHEAPASARPAPTTPTFAAPPRNVGSPHLHPAAAHAFLVASTATLTFLPSCYAAGL